MDYSHTNIDSTGAGYKGQLTEPVPNNGRLIRNLGMASNYLMSHVLHFYHLLALDYVDVNGTGLIPKGFLAPNYDRKFYARGIDPIVQTGGLANPAYTVNNLGNPLATTGPNSGAVLGDLTPYFAGQYVRALKFRRMAQQLGALFTGKMPQASSYTPGCVTVKAYDPSLTGSDTPVVARVHEFLYAGPGVLADCSNLTSVGGYQRSDINNPLNGQPIKMTNPHPESLMGFIGTPKDFWVWAAGGFSPADLPLWAAAGVPTAGSAWKPNTGTYLFDTVAAAHVFPEYFWFGSSYGRTLAWGIFEGGSATPGVGENAGAALGYSDERLITRGRVHTPRCPNPGPTPYSYTHLAAKHQDAREFTPFSFYDDTRGDTQGRHMWQGKTKAVPMGTGPKSGTAYTYAKAPRYDSVGNGTPADFLAYEVGPYARLMSNASSNGLGTSPIGVRGATAGEVLAVDAGAAGVYYPGMLQGVDITLQGVLGVPDPLTLGLGIGVLPGWDANLTAHLTFLQTAIPGSPALYLMPGGIPGTALNNTFPWNYSGDSTLDRVACRALETYYVGAQMLNWFNALTPGVSSNKELSFAWGALRQEKVPKNRAKGAGLTEAPRGALGHWIKIGKPNKSKIFKRFRGKVSNYHIITPTTWNINPKDHLGNHGPAEQAILDTPMVDTAEPLEILRVIHSFDFCCACTVHVFNAKKEKTFEGTLEALP
ncbi:MAG: nickel-dependent hydrogenase large subunit [Planctomycetota bacterium]